MEKLTTKEILPLLGKTFKDTLIVDEVLGPFFIIRYAEGGFGVMRTRRDASGNLRWKVQGYPSTFIGCLDMIAKELHNEEGKVFESIQDYISEWKNESTRILNAYKDWKVNLI